MQNKDVPVCTLFWKVCAEMLGNTRHWDCLCLRIIFPRVTLKVTRETLCSLKKKELRQKLLYIFQTVASDLSHWQPREFWQYSSAVCPELLTSFCWLQNDQSRKLTWSHGTKIWISVNELRLLTAHKDSLKMFTNEVKSAVCVVSVSLLI